MDSEDGDGDGSAVTRLRRSTVSSEVSEMDVLVSSPDSIHWETGQGDQRLTAD